MREAFTTAETVDYLSRVVPTHLRAGLQRYVEAHIEPGGFLRACLENDYREAMLRADYALNLQDLRNVALVIASFPDAAHGSRENVQAWIESGKGAEAS